MYLRIIAVYMVFILSISIALPCRALCARLAEEASHILADDSTGEEAVEDDAVAAPTGKPKKKGNFFTRFFKGIGKVFKRKKDDGAINRMTEKDAEKFESAGVMRVEDSRTPPTASLSDAEEADANKHLAKGRELLQGRRFSEAIAELSLAASLNPRLAEAYNLLGVAYDSKGMSGLARQSFERSIKLNSKDAQTRNNLGYLLYCNGDYHAAMEHLKKAAKLAPKDSRIWNNLALAQFHSGKYDDALKSFSRAGGEFTGRTNMAVMFAGIGNAAEAIKHYEAALRLKPNERAVLQHLVTLYKQSGRNDEAELARRMLDDQARKHNIAIK